jgi:hypothetical protein
MVPLRGRTYKPLPGGSIINHKSQKLNYLRDVPTQDMPALYFCGQRHGMKNHDAKKIDQTPKRWFFDFE